MRTGRLPALAAVAALVVSGCSGEGADPPGDGAATVSAAGPAASGEASSEPDVLPAVEPPAGSTTLTAPGLTLSVPPAWETGDESAAGLTRLAARAELEDGTRAAVELAAVPDEDTDPASALEEVRSLGEVRSERLVTLPRLSTTGPATLVDLEEVVDGEPARTWVLVLGHEGLTWTVSFVSDPFDETLAREILGTLRDA